jgi:hypothetical protein
MRLWFLEVRRARRTPGEKALLCKLVGHRLVYAGHGGDGDVYECVRERSPMPEKYWPPELVERAMP